MKLKFKILLLLLLFSVSSLFAQSNSNWNPLGLTVTGKNTQNGIEAFYQLNKCYNDNVVLIKFINKNASSVTLEWQDAIFTKELRWVSNKKTTTKKAITIEGNKTIFGDCSGICKKELVVKVLDIINNIDNFKLFGIEYFKVTIIK